MDANDAEGRRALKRGASVILVFNVALALWRLFKPVSMTLVRNVDDILQ